MDASILVASDTAADSTVTGTLQKYPRLFMVAILAGMVRQRTTPPSGVALVVGAF
ncbi:MAG: hypothetical protein M3P94_07165 [Chloroflexota bacterium]|nr:hypothetical protein [Chloroflexota bacterium]